MICIGVVKNPTNCGECQKPFCTQCLDNICPNCQKPLKPTTNLPLKNIIETISISCPNKCDKIVVYREITKHLSEICEKRTRNFTCDQCETSIHACGIKDQRIKDHLEICRNYEVDCIFCNSKIKRKLLASHVEICSKRLLNCNVCSTIYPADMKTAHNSYYCDIAKFYRIMKEKLEKL